MELQWAIDILQETYKSIDIRTFTIFKDDKWNNIFTIIRFRRETPEELKVIHEERIKKCNGLIQTDRYRIDVFQLDISKWLDIDKNLIENELCLSDDFRIDCGVSIVLNQNLTESNPTDIEHVFKDWPVFHGENETGRTKPPYNYELQDYAIKKKFRDFDEYLAAIFQMDRYFFQQASKIFTFAPVFFKIDKVIFNHDNVEISYSTFNQKELEISINFFNAEFHRKSEFLNQKTEKIELPNSSKLIQDTLSIKIDTTILGNEFSILVIKNEILRIAELHERIGDYWKGRSEFTNPLYGVFEKFVDYNKLQKMLFDFESNNFKQPSKVFEQGVSWLFSLLGIPNIWLGEYDQIHENGKQISSDVIGVISKNEVIIVHVTTGLPKQSDFDREKEYRENLIKIIQNKDLKINSIYVTGSEPTESINSADANDIVLVGKSRLQSILDYLQKGEISEAREFLFTKF